MICNVSDATGQLDGFQLSFYGSMPNRLPVLARRPPLSASTVVSCVGARLDCESFELSFVMHSVRTFAVLGVEFLLDCDFELVGFLAASLPALAAASICSFALFKVEDSAK